MPLPFFPDKSFFRMASTVCVMSISHVSHTGSAPFFPAIPRDLQSNLRRAVFRIHLITPYLSINPLETCSHAFHQYPLWPFQSSMRILVEFIHISLNALETTDVKDCEDRYSFLACRNGSSAACSTCTVYRLANHCDGLCT